ncbi:MAG: hypothetical protein QOJ38_977 [Solirubrobacterales bacterium]|jgi:DNA-directed RNA polymerase specialized sigma24 family protein|nr:hypothetical protein [Solirubrobacterales bacterium]
MLQAEAPAAERQDDDLTIRAVARGDQQALARMLQGHMDAIYGLLRMALPNVNDVEEALNETFLAAAHRADEAVGRSDTLRWLKELALEQIAARALPAAPVPLHAAYVAAAAAPSGLPASLLDGVTDRALAVLVRTLDPRTRQVLVLDLNFELEDAAMAAVIRCQPGEVGQLRATAMAGLRDRLVEHNRRDNALKREMSRGNAHYLRPLPSLPNGTAVIKGDKVYVEQTPNGLLGAVIRIVRKFIERMTQVEPDLDDDVGGGGKPSKTPDPTPTLRPIARPKLTPSLETYQLPRSSAGTAEYRTPGLTPSTRRLSSSPSPVASSAAWSSARLWRGR